MLECNFQGFQELQFWKWNIQHFIIQDVRCLYQTDDALVGSSIHFVTRKPCSNWQKEMKSINLIVMDEHVQQMFHSSIFDGLWFRLLRVTIMGCKANFRWIIQPKLMSYSLNNIIISMKLWPWGMEKKNIWGWDIHSIKQFNWNIHAEISKPSQFQRKIIILWFLQRPEMHNLQQAKYFEEHDMKASFNCQQKLQGKRVLFSRMNHIADK